MAGTGKALIVWMLDGTTHLVGKSPIREGEVMTADECACLIIKAAGKSKREEIMGLRGKISQWIQLIAPGVIDSIALRAIERGK